MRVKTIELASCRSGVINVPSLTTTEQNSYEVCESFDFGASLQNVYPLLRFVFEYLRYADLKSAREVNNTWGKYAEEELAKRNGLSWLCLTKSKGRHIFERSANFTYDEVAFSLVFYKNTHMMMYTSISLHGTEQRKYFVDYLSTEALRKCKEFWTFSCNHVSHMVSPKKSTSLFSILSIPSIPHVAIRRFYFSEPGSIGNVLDANLQSDEIIDCLLVFSMLRSECYIETVLKEIILRQEDNAFAVGGGLMDSINVFSNTSNFLPENRLCCVAFTRKRDTLVDFEAFSLLSEKEEFKAEVSDFRSRISLRKNSFIIMEGREKDQIEPQTALIRKYFPQTPVFAFSTQSIIGWNRLPGRKGGHLSLCRWGTSVLVLITWGPKV